MNNSIPITLLANGQLAAVLGDKPSNTRVVPLYEKNLATTLRTILENQTRNRQMLGEDGNPTSKQLEHLERHQTFSNDKCVFCQFEGRTTHVGRPKPKFTTERRPDGVEIRRFTPKDKTILTEDDGL